ncbi:MAG: alpha/beta hydrolase [Chryseolinea sp.]
MLRNSIVLLLTIFMYNTAAQNNFSSGYAQTKAIEMYYEIRGQGPALVLVHGGGSTIASKRGRVIDGFAKTRKVIAVELQAHGHTKDIARALSFEQDADDVHALLKALNIAQADFIGFSNGGNTVMQIAIRHPAQVKRIAVCSSFFKREGIYPQVWDFISNGTVDSMPQALKDAYLTINNDKNGLKAMHDRDRQRMVDFSDCPVDQLRGIQAETLLVIGDSDIVKPEHAVEMYRLIPAARLAVLPGGHGMYLGEITMHKVESRQPHIFVELVNEFLN